MTTQPPSVHRNRNSTYDSAIYITASPSWTRRDERGREVPALEEEFTVGRIPVMLNSSICLLTLNPRKDYVNQCAQARDPGSHDGLLP